MEIKHYQPEPDRRAKGERVSDVDDVEDLELAAFGLRRAGGVSAPDTTYSSAPIDASMEQNYIEYVLPYDPGQADAHLWG